MVAVGSIYASRLLAARRGAAASSRRRERIGMGGPFLPTASVSRNGTRGAPMLLLRKQPVKTKHAGPAVLPGSPARCGLCSRYVRNMSRSVMTRVWRASVLLWTASSALTGCGKPSTIDSLARAGRINSAAPVQARVQTAISAPPAAVWALLINAPQWTAWNPQIEHVDAAGPLREGMTFAWGSGGISITSKVRLFEPSRRLAWTGAALMLHAVHVWELRAVRASRPRCACRSPWRGRSRRTSSHRQSWPTQTCVGCSHWKTAAEHRP